MTVKEVRRWLSNDLGGVTEAVTSVTKDRHTVTPSQTSVTKSVTNDRHIVTSTVTIPSETTLRRIMKDRFNLKYALPPKGS